MTKVIHYKNEQGQIIAKFKLHGELQEVVLNTNQEKVLRDTVFERLQEKDAKEDRLEELNNEIELRQEEIQGFEAQIEETQKEVEELEASLQEFDNIFTDLFTKEEESQEQ